MDTGARANSKIQLNDIRLKLVVAKLPRTGLRIVVEINVLISRRIKNSYREVGAR